MLFEINKEYPEAQHATYLNFPTQRVWNHTSKTWTVRQKGYLIGQLPLAHSNYGE